MFMCIFVLNSVLKSGVLNYQMINTISEICSGKRNQRWCRAVKSDGAFSLVLSCSVSIRKRCGSVSGSETAITRWNCHLGIAEVCGWSQEWHSWLHPHTDLPSARRCPKCHIIVACTTAAWASFPVQGWVILYEERNRYDLISSMRTFKPGTLSNCAQHVFWLGSLIILNATKWCWWLDEGIHLSLLVHGKNEYVYHLQAYLKEGRELLVFGRTDT